jgi:hypothetical protein
MSDDETAMDVDDDEISMDVDDPPDRSSTFVTFNCSTPGCVKQYRLYSNLVKHHDRGDHLFMPDKINLRDRAILMYKDRAESVKPTQIHQLNNFTVVHSTSVSGDDDEPQKEVDNNHHYQQQGWALSKSKTMIRYSPEQIKYLIEKYNEGEASGHKWNPSAVSSVSNLKNDQNFASKLFFQEMETKEENGQFVFEPHQFLTPTQIRSFFSRLTAARREQANRNQSQTIPVNQGDDEDIITEQENEFESALSDYNEDSVRSQALQVLQAIQPGQLFTTYTTSV